MPVATDRRRQPRHRRRHRPARGARRLRRRGQLQERMRKRRRSVVAAVKQGRTARPSRSKATWARGRHRARVRRAGESARADHAFRAQLRHHRRRSRGSTKRARKNARGARRQFVRRAAVPARARSAACRPGGGQRRRDRDALVDGGDDRRRRRIRLVCGRKARGGHAGRSGRARSRQGGHSRQCDLARRDRHRDSRRRAGSSASRRCCRWAGAGTPDEVAEAILFLLSDAASYITGSESRRVGRRANPSLRDLAPASAAYDRRPAYDQADRFPHHSRGETWSRQCAFINTAVRKS